MNRLMTLTSTISGSKTLRVALVAGLAAAAMTAQGGEPIKDVTTTTLASGANGSDADGVQRELITLTRGLFTERYRVGDLGGKSVSVSRVGNPFAPAERYFYEEGYKLHARVMVKAVSGSEPVGRAVDELIGAGLVSGVRVLAPKSANLSEYVVVETNTVRDAIDLSRLIQGQPGIEWASVDTTSPNQNLGLPTDPFVANGDQWHLKNLGPLGNDHKLEAVYDKGYSGEGIVVGILEFSDGNFHTPLDDLTTNEHHPDLVPNYRPDLSMAVTPFPTPPAFSHATAVAGLVAADDNGIMGAGVAFNAGLAQLAGGSGVNFFNAFMHELERIDLKNHSWGPVHIGNGWGPPFIPIDELGPLFSIRSDYFTQLTAEYTAMQEATINGREGKGQIQVFAAGNENMYPGALRFIWGSRSSLPSFGGDRSCPGGFYDWSPSEGWIIPCVPPFPPMDTTGVTFTTFGARTELSPLGMHRRNLNIAAVGENDVIAGYSTTGCSVFVAGYSQGTTGGRAITTTDGINADNPSGFTNGFNGTSAAAPIVAGIVALMLEANSDLGYRDIQHILQKTAKVVNFDPARPYLFGDFSFLTGRFTPFGWETAQLWQVNGGFIPHSDEYGFGIVDADAAIAMAETWPGVDRQLILDTQTITIGEDGAPEDGEIEDAEFFEFSETFSALFSGDSLSYGICVRPNMLIEAVEVTLTVKGIEGDLLVFLTSPHGTISVLELPRPAFSGVGVGGETYAMYDYTFTSFKHWGELSGGEWAITFVDWRPNEATPIGDDLPDPPDPDDDGVDMVTSFGPFGQVGFSLATDCEVIDYRLRLFTTDVGEPVFEGCSVFTPGCPGDLNGDGFVDIRDLLKFYDWWISASIFADINGDGFIDSQDILAFYTFWLGNNGPCDRDPNTSGPSRPIDNGGVITIG